MRLLIGECILWSSLLLGIAARVVVEAVYSAALSIGALDAEARALAFTTMIFGNLELIFANRSRSYLIFTTLRIPNPSLWWVIAATLTGLIIVIYVPTLQDLLRFSRLHVGKLTMYLVAAHAAILWVALLKLWPVAIKLGNG